MTTTTITDTDLGRIQEAITNLQGRLQDDERSFCRDARRYNHLVSLALGLCAAVMSEGAVVPMAQDLEDWIKAGGPMTSEEA